MPDTTRHARPRLLLHPPVVGAAAALLIAAFGTDLMYYQTSLIQWANFSAWLIAGGLVVALVAALLLLVDFLLGNTGELLPLQFGALVFVAVLSIFNALIHSRDAWTSVVPEGLTISAIAAVILLAMSFRGWSVTATRVRAERARL